jgi:hypothetical protein
VAHFKGFYSGTLFFSLSKTLINIKMVKGRNKGGVHKSEHQGGNEHLKGKEKNKITNEKKGRNLERDQSGGTKKKNAI